MRVIKYINIDTKEISQYKIVKNVDLLSSDQVDLILKSCNRDANVLRNMFNTVGIEYNDLLITNGTVLYKLDDKLYHISELSHGEKYMLYLLACKKFNLKIIADGILEILGNRLVRLFEQEFSNYTELIVVWYSLILSRELRKHLVMEIKGVA